MFDMNNDRVGLFETGAITYLRKFDKEFASSDFYVECQMAIIF